MDGMDSWGEAIFAVSDPKDKQTIQEEYSTSESYQPTHRRREDEVKFWPPIEGEGIKMMQEMGMKSPEPSAPSVTQQNMSYLEDCIDTLFKRVEMLGIRLENILSEGSPEVASDRRSYGGNSPHSEQLAMFCRRLSDLTDRVEYLTARIDL